MQGCCGECEDPFCGFLNDPLQDLNTVNPLPVKGFCHTYFLGNINFYSATGVSQHLSGAGHPFSPGPVPNPVPLYIEHLSLII
jgi:hypothetical protein